jgi:uncharacterized protein (DUF1684 family)
MPTSIYETETMKWREERVERLRTSELSWFGLAGLFWLEEGDNTFGSDPSNKFVLPGSAPKKVGTFHFKNDDVKVTAAPGVKLTCKGRDLPTRVLRHDQEEDPDYLDIERLCMVVIRRGSSTLIRLWDRDNPVRKAFKGLNFYPYKPEYRILAEYKGYAPFRIVRQKDIIGEISDTSMIGYVTFTLGGKEFQLDAEDAGDGLFISFHDKTCADTTYAGGRYLLTDRPEGGTVIVDFNRAYNMPCAYMLYATCGLPSADNRMSVRVEAGETKYKVKDEH